MSVKRTPGKKSSLSIAVIWSIQRILSLWLMSLVTRSTNCGELYELLFSDSANYTFQPDYKYRTRSYYSAEVVDIIFI